jgi:hypothetical protein
VIVLLQAVLFSIIVMQALCIQNVVHAYERTRKTASAEIWGTWSQKTERGMDSKVWTCARYQTLLSSGEDSAPYYDEMRIVEKARYM